MSVYVDNMEAPFGRMIMCHMLADTHEELVSMADKIGVARKWIQKEGQPFEHFDICLAKKKIAITHGAKEICYPMEVAPILQRKRARGSETCAGLASTHDDSKFPTGGSETKGCKMRVRKSDKKAEGEFKRFCDALVKPEPAIKIFTQEALMLIHLVYGDKCLKSSTGSGILK